MFKFNVKPVQPNSYSILQTFDIGMHKRFGNFLFLMAYTGKYYKDACPSTDLVIHPWYLYALTCMHQTCWMIDLRPL